MCLSVRARVAHTAHVCISRQPSAIAAYTVYSGAGRNAIERPGRCLIIAVVISLRWRCATRLYSYVLWEDVGECTKHKRRLQSLINLHSKYIDPTRVESMQQDPWVVSACVFNAGVEASTCACTQQSLLAFLLEVVFSCVHCVDASSVPAHWRGCGSICSLPRL